MKIGVISDIHARLAALERALELLERFGAEQIVCAGDLAEKGPDGDAVVSLIRARGIPCVQGNHDRDAVGNQEWLRENAIPNHPHLINDDSVNFLLDLPPALHSTIAGKRVTLTHGSPWSRDVYIYANSPRIVYERIAEETRADVVILGHTHVPMRVRLGGMVVLNPGSVMPEGSHTCGLLSLPDLRWQVIDIGEGAPVTYTVTEFND